MKAPDSETGDRLAGELAPKSQHSRVSSLARRVGILALVLVSYFALLRYKPNNDANPFEHLGSHCAHTTPITSSTFLQRQSALARVLKDQHLGAYITEPGPSATYFANISLADWKLSERVFLLVVTPEAQVHVLAPKFEQDRAKLLRIPSQEDVQFILWAEEEDPYEVLFRALGKKGLGGFAVDEGLRLFVSEGLKRAGGDGVRVDMAPPSVRALREQKGPEEITLMRCANEVTLMAIRAVRERMYIGIRESQVKQLMNLALASAGLKNAFALVQFGENAALPHGSGSDRTLLAQDMVLIDTGGSLHDYQSDVTRTFALPKSVIPDDHIRIWETVSKVQAYALSVARQGVEARRVDEAARVYMNDEQVGMAQYFSHRLGHGIGLEGHEAPYLRRGPDNVHRLEAGNAMSDEPGIYILGQVGVRLEDCFYIGDEGGAVLLTAGVGGFAKNLWEP
ncbi:Creatinase/aminopeptidase [Rhizoctonia solani]|nr:Creatinase/aminopeptidase [Rhizoctonia solani]